jgi:uncharacterized HAD superfamily protein
MPSLGSRGGRVAPVGQIYVDLDDVLSHTIEPLVELLEKHFGRRVEVEAVEDFDLGRSFGLDACEIEEFMRRVHTPELLASLRPKPGAARALGGWLEQGYEVCVMTGRPPSTAGASRDWLKHHRIPHTSLACVDKYGRPDPAGRSEPALALDALPGLGFALAIEDSLEMAVHLAQRCGVAVALLDRPWNRDLSRLSEATAHRIVRCRDWAEIAARFPAP